jgi:type I site-specific restriction-modification system R (restriction) subunit
MHTMYIDKPMRGHGLMQVIARVNRVFKDKPGGLVVDYLGLAHELKAALAPQSKHLLQAPRRAIDDYFRELEPLLKRSICAVDLEEQPLPRPLASPEMMESQPELMGALHPRW